MKEDLVIHKLNESHVYIETSIAIVSQLSDSFTFYANNYKYHPKFKAKLWDGKIRLFNAAKSTMLLGLCGDLIKFCKENDYTFKFNFSKTCDYNQDIYNKVINGLDKNKVISLYDHQKVACDFSLRLNRCVIESATGSGKSLIMYVVVMYYLLYGYENVLIIVNKKGLCEQIKKEFVEYAGEYKEELEKSIGLLYDGSKKREGDIIIATWQSLQNQDKEFFNKFNLVIVDECHGISISSSEIQKILEKCVNACFRFGFTATISNPEDKTINELLLKGLFGPIKNVLTNTEGIKRGVLTKPIIHAYKFNYEDIKLRKRILKGSKDLQEEYERVQDYSLYRKKLYNEELSYIFQSHIRNKFISDLALSKKGNVLIFFYFVETHGKVIKEMLEKECVKNGKTLFYIDAGVGVEEREHIRAEIEKRNDLIILASLGTTSTGIDSKNLDSLIYANVNRSYITVKQSIGRMLRILKGKEKVDVYDIGDFFGSYKGKENFLYDHFKQRLNYYSSEGFEVRAKEFNIRENKIYG